MNPLLKKLPFWGCLLLAVVVFLYELNADHQFHADLIHDVATARLDTTRKLTLKSRLLGDSLVAVQRRALQVAQRADELDRALALERKAKIDLQVKVRALEVSARSTPVAVVPVKALLTDSVRRGEFTIRDAPYSVKASVELPPPPAAGAMHIAVTLDSIPLSIRLGCASPQGSAVRAAQVTAIAPTWIDARLDHVEQSADVCRESPVRSSLFAGRVGVFAGVAAVRRPDGTVVAGLGVGVGLRLWP